MIELNIKCDICGDKIGEMDDIACVNCHEALDKEKEEYLDEIGDMHRKIEGLEYENHEFKKEIEKLKEAKK